MNQNIYMTFEQRKNFFEDKENAFYEAERIFF